MIDIYEIAKEVAKQLNIDYDIALQVCQHPFMFTVQKMKDNSDSKSILFNELFKFKIKSRFTNDKSRDYSPFK